MRRELSDRFAPRVAKAIELAQVSAARAFRQTETGDLLLSLIDLGEGAAYSVLESFLISPDNVRSRLEAAEFATIEQRNGDAWSDAAQAALQIAAREQHRLRKPFIGTEDVLVGLLAELNGAGGRVLRELGLDAPTVRRRIWALQVPAIYFAPMETEGEALPWDEAKPEIEAAETIESRLDDREAAWVHDRGSDLVRDEALVGLAVGVLVDGELVHFSGLGLADLQRRAPITCQTSFRIASITKTLTAIAVMQLYEERLVTLDGSVNDYLAAFRVIPPEASASPITLRQLLTHTAGLVRGGGLRHYGTPPPPLSEFYGPELNAEWPAGERWSYSNHGFAVLGQVVEDVVGSSFRDYMARHVFDRLGMRRTDLANGASMGDAMATGYWVDAGQVSPVRWSEIILAGAGAAVSNVEDMARFVEALWSGGANRFGRVLLRDTLDLMFQPNCPIPGTSRSQGLAFWVDQIREQLVVTHTGGWPGFHAVLTVAPARRMGVVVFANSGTGALDDFGTTLVGHLLESGRIP